MNTVGSIQALRGIAALLVTTLHLVLFTSGVTKSAAWEQATVPAHAFGNAGVDLFFCISGAIMYLIMHRLSGASGPGAAASFLIRRGLRIYPLYWAALLVMVLFVTAEPVTWKDPLLLHFPAAFAVAWTLPFELRFYLAVSLILLLPVRLRGYGFGLWAVFQIGLVIFQMTSQVPFDMGHAINLEFVFGVGVGALLAHRLFHPVVAKMSIGFALAWFGSAAYVCWLETGLINPWRALLFGVPGAFLLYGVVALDMMGKLKTPKALNFLGDISYSLYLWHLVVLNLFLLWWPLPVGTASETMVFLASAIGMILVVSTASFYLLERPAIALGHVLAGALKKRPAVTPAIAIPAE